MSILLYIFHAHHIGNKEKGHHQAQGLCLTMMKIIDLGQDLLPVSLAPTGKSAIISKEAKARPIKAWEMTL